MCVQISRKVNVRFVVRICNPGIIINLTLYRREFFFHTVICWGITSSEETFLLVIIKSWKNVSFILHEQWFDEHVQIFDHTPVCVKVLKTIEASIWFQVVTNRIKKNIKKEPLFSLSFWAFLSENFLMF